VPASQWGTRSAAKCEIIASGMPNIGFTTLEAIDAPISAWAVAVICKNQAKLGHELQLTIIYALEQLRSTLVIIYISKIFMIPAFLTIGNFALPTISFFLFFGFLLFLFLFWRAAKHEFVDEAVVFDTIVICLLSALFFARIFEFATHSDVYKWSFSNFFFLNPVKGLSLWGAIFGSIVSGILYLKNKKYNFWQVFDLCAAPFFLFLAIYKLGLFLGSKDVVLNLGFFKNLQNSFFQAILFFVLFWVLKRLERKKRHAGFFASFFFVSFSAISLISLFLDKLAILAGVESSQIIGILSSQALFATVLLLFGGLSWYILARRKVKEDTKGLLALFLLILFRAKRILTSVSEADEIARSIVLLPYNFAIFALVFARAAGKEIISSFFDFMHTLGIKK